MHRGTPAPAGAEQVDAPWADHREGDAHVPFLRTSKTCHAKRVWGLAERVQDEESVDEQAEAVGLPLDERAAWKRVADKRRVKSVEFVADKDASWGNLVWLVIASPMLVLHWKLFKHAKWSSEVDVRKEEAGLVLKQFCLPALNPAADVIDKLFELLRVPHERMRCVCFFHGPCAQWPPARQRAFQQLVLLAAGQLWRKLVLPWQGYPWKMWPIVWGESEDERCRAASLLLAERDCCLDEVFTQKLKLLVPDPQTLASESTLFVVLFHTLGGYLHICGAEICQLRGLERQTSVRLPAADACGQARDELLEGVR